MVLGVASLLQACRHKPTCLEMWRSNFPTTTAGDGLHSKWRGGDGHAALTMLLLRAMSSEQCRPLMRGYLIPVGGSHWTTCQGLLSSYFRLLTVYACTLGYLGRAGGKLLVRVALRTMTPPSLRHSRETCEAVVGRRRISS
ncbi:hypothetical protein MRX96_051146 [Rhipicephalus microplus]